MSQEIWQQIYYQILQRGVDENARFYFDRSTPGKYFDIKNPQPPAFQNPDPNANPPQSPNPLIQ